MFISRDEVNRIKGSIQLLSSNFGNDREKIKRLEKKIEALEKHLKINIQLINEHYEAREKINIFDVLATKINSETEQTLNQKKGKK